MTLERWIIVGLAAALVALWFGSDLRPDPAEDALRAQTDSLKLQVAQLGDIADAAQGRATAAEAARDAYADSLTAERLHVAQVTQESRRRLQAATQTAESAEGRLTALLEAAGLTTADVDSVRAARIAQDRAHAEIEAALRREVATVSSALSAADSLAAAERAAKLVERARADAAVEAMGLLDVRLGISERARRAAELEKRGALLCGAGSLLLWQFDRKVESGVAAACSLGLAIR